MRLAFLFSFALIIHTQSAWSNEVESVNEGIQQVQKELRDPKAVERTAQQSQGAKELVQKVRDMSGTEENETAIYDLAAEVMGNMKGKSLEEILKTIEQASKNPAGFADSFSPEQKQKLKAIAERMPSSKKAKP